MITITLKAAEKLRDVMKDDNKDPEKGTLRVFVQGGGCSGFQYGLTLNEENSPADIHFESNGIKIIVDPISISYLKDAEVDYVDYIDGTTGSGFSIKNPQATSTCGCGQSFNTD